MLEKLKYLFNPLYRRPTDENAEGIRYAGFTQRLNAIAFDMIIFMVLLYPVFAFISYITYNGHDLATIAEAIREQYPSYITPPPEVIQAALIENNFFTRFFLNMFLGYLVMTVVYIYCGYKFQGTPGKMLMGYKIVDAKTNGRITLKQSILRTLSYTLSMLPLGLGFIAINFNKQKQGWHDRISGTVVLNIRTDFSKFEKLIQTIKGLFLRKHAQK